MIKLFFKYSILIFNVFLVGANEESRGKDESPENFSSPIVGRDGRIFLPQSLFWPWNTWSPFAQAGHAICKETCLRLGKDGGHYILDFDPDLSPTSIGRCDCNCPTPESTKTLNLCPSKVACANFCIHNTFNKYAGGSCGRDNHCTCNCNLNDVYDINASWLPTIKGEVVNLEEILPNEENPNESVHSLPVQPSVSSRPSEDP